MLKPIPLLLGIATSILCAFVVHVNFGYVPFILGFVSVLVGITAVVLTATIEMMFNFDKKNDGEK